jgi:hypothetical protein
MHPVSTQRGRVYFKNCDAAGRLLAIALVGLFILTAATPMADARQKVDPMSCQPPCLGKECQCWLYDHMGDKYTMCVCPTPPPPPPQPKSGKRPSTVKTLKPIPGGLKRNPKGPMTVVPIGPRSPAPSLGRGRGR